MIQRTRIRVEYCEFNIVQNHHIHTLTSSIIDKFTEDQDEMTKCEMMSTIHTLQELSNSLQFRHPLIQIILIVAQMYRCVLCNVIGSQLVLPDCKQLPDDVEASDCIHIGLQSSTNVFLQTRMLSY